VVVEPPLQLFWNQTIKSLASDRNDQERPLVYVQQGDDGTIINTSTIIVVDEQRKQPLPQNDPLVHYAAPNTTTIQRSAGHHQKLIKVRKKDYIMNVCINGAPIIVIEQYKLIFFTIQKMGCSCLSYLFYCLVILLYCSFVSSTSAL
jgi:hypothetical protein